MGGIFNKLVNLFMNRLSVNQTLMNMINHGALSLKERAREGEKGERRCRGEEHPLARSP